MSNDENPEIHGSNPCSAATNANESAGSPDYRTDGAQNPAESEPPPVRFPRTIRFRKAQARIYGRTKAYAFYRVCAYVAGKRRMTSYATYSEARDAADKLVRDIASGSQAAGLTATQAADALAALQRLDTLRQDTGRRFSLLGAVAEFADATRKLRGHALVEAVDGFLGSVATVKHVTLHEAIEQFISFRNGKTVAAEGRRPQLSPEHAYNTALWLREFDNAFPGHAVGDLTKQHLDAYMGKFAGSAPKTRNERRGVVKMFLRWCIEQDYLAATCRLFGATGLKHENADPDEIDYYRPNELRAMLENADKDLLPFVALAGLAGLREREIVRLTWEDVFRVPGHVEVGALKAKTRSRRLVEMVPALAAWLEPYRGRTGALWTDGYDAFHVEFGRLRDSLKVPHRRNGLRHAFVSAHYAMHADEGLTAKEAGNSPQMVHKNYKGLLTRKQGEAWFSVAPAKPGNVVLLSETGAVD